jgi:C4-dicarboxylate transporter DctM subunit
MARFKGGLAMAAVLACAAFGAICGSSGGHRGHHHQVALPEMRRHGYNDRLATGTLAAGGTLGILIPPSVPLVVYAILAEQNIAKLFAAAMIPGLIAMLGYMRPSRSMCAWCPARRRARRRAAPDVPRCGACCRSW